MIDFIPFRNKEMTLGQLTAELTLDDWRRLTDEMVDAMLALIADCVDADVTFVPEDPEAHDAYAEDAAETEVAWTLGHVIVHTTASAEESAAVAAELARGVEYHGRSRSELPWQTITTIEQCRHRLEESRRMRQASLDMWPDPPHLDNDYEIWSDFEPINAVRRLALGLNHDDVHRAQIAEIVRQAQVARA